MRHDQLACAAWIDHTLVRPTSGSLVAVLFGMCLVTAPVSLRANPTVITFAGLPDSTLLSDQYLAQGLTFSDAIILTAGISLDEFEFPPIACQADPTTCTNSGVNGNVASDNDGPMRIDFTTPVDNVGGYFTYGTQLTLDAFSATNTLLGSVESPFSNNEAISGNPPDPNEFLELPFNNTSYVTFTGDSAGSSFALSDLTFTPVPAPIVGASLPGLIAACGGLVVAALRRRRQSHLIHHLNLGRLRHWARASSHSACAGDLI